MILSQDRETQESRIDRPDIFWTAIAASLVLGFVIAYVAFFIASLAAGRL